MKTYPRAKGSAGFTLVELLVVIAIIGILAAILIPTLAAAIRSAHEGAIAVELNKLELALEQYRLANGQVLPPDFTVGLGASGSTIPPTITGSGTLPTRLTAHANRISNKRLPADLIAFANGTDTDGDSTNGSYVPIITPDEALVLWLQRTRTSAQFPFTGDGIYDDPTLTPATDTNGAGVSPDPGVFDFIKDQCRVYYEFDERRLRDYDNDGYMSYYPPHGAELPYVYFHFSTYLRSRFNPNDLNANGTPAETPADFIPDSLGIARPYASAVRPTSTTDVVDFHAEDKFQIICAGFDGDYGTSSTYSSVSGSTITVNPNNIKVFPTGTQFSKGDRDNFGTFADSRMDKELDN